MAWAQLNADNIAHIVTDQPIGIPCEWEDAGRRWNGVAFEPVAPVVDWRIDLGPFYDRFGALMIPILASADPVVQACIKAVEVRKYIDLKRPDLAAMLDLIIAAGFQIDKAAILAAPSPSEQYRGAP